MLIFGIAFRATMVSMFGFTGVLGLRTSLVVRINAAIVFGGIFVVYGFYLSGIRNPG